MQGLVSNRVAVCWKRKVILWIKILTIFLSYVRPLSTSRIIFITFHASSRVALCIFYAFRILQIPRALYFSFVFLYSPDFLILLSFLYFFPFLRLASISFDRCNFCAEPLFKLSTLSVCFGKPDHSNLATLASWKLVAETIEPVHRTDMWKNINRKTRNSYDDTSEYSLL